MKEYSLKDIILGLRGEYQQLQSELETMKQSLRTGDVLVEPEQILTWVADKNRIEFYIPTKKKHKLKLLGSFSMVDKEEKNQILASDFTNDELKVLNDDYGVLIYPDEEKSFYEAAMRVLNSQLVVDPPYKCTYLTPGFQSLLFIRANGIHASESYAKCFDYIVDYNAASDQVVVHTDYEEAHSVILRQALEKKTPASVFNQFYQNKIESVQDKKLETPFDAAYFFESSYKFAEDKDNLVLKRVSGKNR